PLPDCCAGGVSLPVPPPDSGCGRGACPPAGPCDVSLGKESFGGSFNGSQPAGGCWRKRIHLDSPVCGSTKRLGSLPGGYETNGVDLYGSQPVGSFNFFHPGGGDSPGRI